MEISIFQLENENSDILNFGIFHKEIDENLEDAALLREILVTKKEALKTLNNAKGNSYKVFLSFDTCEEFCNLMQIVSFLNDFGKGFILQIILNNTYEISEE